MDDPIGKMIMDAVTAPYHNEEKALQSLVPSKKTEYVPAPTSEIRPLKIVWSEQGVTVSPQEIQTIINPFQLMPTQIKNNFISYMDERVSTTETNRMTKLTGVWESGLVGPLEGKAWEKEVPLVIDTMTRHFYTHTPDSQLIAPDIQFLKMELPLAGQSEIFVKLYNTFKEKDWAKPVYTSFVQQIMKSAKLPDLPWYNSRRYSGYNPINWNPLTKNISDVLAKPWWGDYVFEAPTPIWLERQKETNAITEEEYYLQQGWGLAAANFRHLIDEWIDEAVDEWFTKDTDGWFLEQGWGAALGYYILTAGKVIEENGIIVDNMVDAVMAMELSHLENQSTRQFLLNNPQHLKAFMDTNVMVWLMALQLPLEYEDYINEWLYDLDN